MKKAIEKKYPHFWKDENFIKSNLVGKKYVKYNPSDIQKLIEDWKLRFPKGTYWHTTETYNSEGVAFEITKGNSERVAFEEPVPLYSCQEKLYYRPAFIYIHTITEYKDITFPETVVYIGRGVHNQKYPVGCKSAVYRAYQKSEIEGRHPSWKSIVEPHNYTVTIICENIYLGEAKELEDFLIEYVGRFITDSGVLCNIRRAGEIFTISEESKKQRRKTIQKRHLKALKSDELYQEALRNGNPKAIKYRDELAQAFQNGTKNPKKPKTWTLKSIAMKDCQTRPTVIKKKSNATRNNWKKVKKYAHTVYYNYPTFEDYKKARQEDPTLHCLNTIWTHYFATSDSRRSSLCFWI